MAGIFDAFRLFAELIDTIAPGAGSAVEAVFSDAKPLVAEALAPNAVYGRSDISFVQKVLKDALIRAGLRKVSDHLLKTFAVAVERFSAASPDFVVGSDAIQQLQESVQATAVMVDDLASSLDGDVKELLGLAVRQPLSSIDLADKLRDRMGTKGRYARTIIETQLKAAQRAMAVKVGEDNGITRYIYLGPDDTVTRLFCEEMVGRAYTIEMLDACDNGQLPDVIATGGGYNCRHQALPIPDGTLERQFPGAAVPENGWATKTIVEGKREITVIA